MRFREIAAEAQEYERKKRLSHARPGSRRIRPRTGFGWIVDLFGDFPIEELTPLLIEEKLESIAGLAPQTVNAYRSNLSFICEYAVEKGVLSANPVIPRSRIRRKDNEQLIERDAVELRDRVIEHRNRQRPENTSERDKRAQDRKRTEGLAKLQRDGISLIRRIAGNAAAEMVQALCGLGSSHLRGPRTADTKKAYERVVRFVAKNSDASDYEVGKRCKVDRKLVERWRATEQFKQDVRVARHEVPTEEEIHAANSKARKIAAINQPDVISRKSAAMKKKFVEDQDYAAAVLASPAISHKDPAVERRRSKGLKNSWKKDHDQRVEAIRNSGGKISASLKKRWREDAGYREHQEALRKDPVHRAKLSESVEKSWDQERRAELQRAPRDDDGRFLNAD